MPRKSGENASRCRQNDAKPIEAPFVAERCSTNKIDSTMMVQATHNKSKPKHIRKQTVEEESTRAPAEAGTATGASWSCLESAFDFVSCSAAVVVAAIFVFPAVA